jgi:hypothetical protein
MLTDTLILVLGIWGTLNVLMVLVAFRAQKVMRRREVARAAMRTLEGK